MKIDFLLPLSLFLIVTLSLLLSEKIEKKIKMILGEKKLGTREIFLMVISMSIMVSLIILLPTYWIQILFIIAFSYMLLIFTYLLLGKWFLAIIPPAIFVASYLLIYTMMEDILIVNTVISIFTAFFAVMIITYMNSLFSWRITVLFAVLLTVMDVIQVFLTTHMIEAANKMITLRLPVAMILPTFPLMGYMVLGLGDVFLSGLLSTQAAYKYGRRAGFLIAASISLALFIFEALIFNLEIELRGFPATIIVLLGCLLGLGIHNIEKRLTKCLG
ncbi:MAG: hypothetical protein QXX94_05930 [Candidatus Bathyarchaeia archaeon]